MKRGSDTYTHTHTHTHTLPPYKQQSNHVPSHDFLKCIYRLYSKSVVFTSNFIFLIFTTLLHYRLHFPHTHHCLRSHHHQFPSLSPLTVFNSTHCLLFLLSTTLFIIFTKLSLFPSYSQLFSYSLSVFYQYHCCSFAVTHIS